jgi:hypothetical protein
MKAGRKPFSPPPGTVIDWSQPNGLIAKQLGISVPTAFELRKRLGIPPLHRGRQVREVLQKIN